MKPKVWETPEEFEERRREFKARSHDGKPQLTKKAALVRMYSLAEKTGRWFAAYPCRFCEWWHVGSYEKIASRDGLKPAGPPPGRIPAAAPPSKQGIGDALGDMKEELRKAFPHTPLSHWNEHLRLCAHCIDAFPRGRRLCRDGDILYFQRLAWQVRQIVKERRGNGKS